MTKLTALFTPGFVFHAKWYSVSETCVWEALADWLSKMCCVISRIRVKHFNFLFLLACYLPVCCWRVYSDMYDKCYSRPMWGTLRHGPQLAIKQKNLQSIYNIFFSMVMSFFAFFTDRVQLACQHEAAERLYHDRQHTKSFILGEGWGEEPKADYILTTQLN